MMTDKEITVCRVGDEEKRSDYMWSIGDVVELSGVVNTVIPLSTYYGVSYLTRFDIDGNTAISFISKELVKGKKYTFVGVKVEEYQQYNGEKQTRVKISFRKKVNREEAEKHKSIGNAAMWLSR